MADGLLPTDIDDNIPITHGLRRAQEVATRVSVIILVFNRDGLIATCVQSVQAQTLTDFEIIVVDDASTDRTSQVVEGLAAQDPRVRLLRCKRNIGPGMARNRGIASSKGAWVALLDSDDEYHPDRLRCLLEIAETTRADMIADNLWFRHGDPGHGDPGDALAAAFRASRNDSDQRCGICPPEHPVGERRRCPTYRVRISQAPDSKKFPYHLRYPIRRRSIFRGLPALPAVPDSGSTMDHRSIAPISLHRYR
jgi:hypothetical protein